MNIQQRARELAVKAAHQDPDLHGYTLDARLLKPWEPHTWVVNAIAEALQGEADASAPEDSQDEPVRMGKMPRHLGAKFVDMIETRTEPLHRRLDRLASMVSMLAKQREAHDAAHTAEGRPAAIGIHRERLNELDARCDALGARIACLESGRTGPRMEIAKVERFATGLRDFLGATETQEKDIAREVVAARRGPPPGVPMPVNINGDIRMRTVSEERPGVMAVQLEPEDVVQPGRVFVDDPTTRSIERASTRDYAIDECLRERDEARRLASVAANKLNEIKGTLATANVELGERARRNNEMRTERDEALARKHDVEQEYVQLSERVRVVLGKYGDAPISTEGIAFVIDEAFRQKAIADGALALANKEWNALREAVNPVLPKDLRDQSLVDAVPALIKRLHGMLHKDASERVEREDAIAAHGDETRKQLDVTTLKLENMVSACADQAIQIMELRGEVNQMRQAHHAELCRKDANRESDFAEGREQNKRLIADNQVLRVENANLRDKMKSAEDRATRAEVSCTGYRERMNEIEDTLKRKDALLQGVTDSAAQVPTLREQLQEAKRLAEQDAPLLKAAEEFTHAYRKEPDATRLSSPTVAIAIGVTTAYDEREAEIKTAIDDAKDCQTGTCDCPSRPGTYDIQHKDGCPESCTCSTKDGVHEIGCPEMPF